MAERKNAGGGILIWLIAIIVPFLLVMPAAVAQDRVKAPVKLKIEDGDFESVSVVLKNNTTGESNTIPGVAKFDLDLKINCDYIISFSKPGYITKRIAFNTTSPSARTSQGFYPFNFEVNLFKQYDGVNIVVFNQPVGKISFNRLIDDFDYDTDYTKQIQSALKLAEDEIKRKQQEERALAEQNKKQEEKRKQEEAKLAKADEKARLEADKKAAEELRLLAIEEAKQKKAEEDQRKIQAKATLEEEKRQLAVAKMEEEERARLKAAEEAEQRPSASAGVGNDSQSAGGKGTAGEDNKQVASASSGSDDRSTGSGASFGRETPTGKASASSGDDKQPVEMAEAVKKQEAGISIAKGTPGEDDNAMGTKKSGAVLSESANENYEKLPDISFEEIVEPLRKIIKVTVRKNQKETIFSKVTYNWGGIYYFRFNLSISESLYKSATGLR